MGPLFLAHPVRGDVPGNLANARRWVRWLTTWYPVTVLASWIVGCEIYDDADEAQRAQGIERNKGAIDVSRAIVLTGGRVTSGMRQEAEHGDQVARIPVYDLSHLGYEPPAGAVEASAWRRWRA